MSPATLYRPHQTGPRPAEYEARCPYCDFSELYDSRVRAVIRQRKRGCPNCDRMLGVSKV